MKTIRTTENEALFFEALGETGNVTEACRIAGLTRSAVYKWREEDSEFAVKWERAAALGIESLEDIAGARARTTSDVLAIFLLKGAKPEKYRERANVELTGKDQGPITIKDDRAPIGHLLAGKLVEDE